MEAESEVFERREYAQREFWNQRFEEYKSPFDWYATWRELRLYLVTLVPSFEYTDVLMVGCGNSSKYLFSSKQGYGK